MNQVSIFYETIQFLTIKELRFYFIHKRRFEFLDLSITSKKSFLRTNAVICPQEVSRTFHVR